MSLFGSVQNTFIPGLIRKIFRIKIVGSENQPKDVSSYVICSNHTSNWDPIILGASTSRPIRYMAKKILFKIPILSLIVRMFGAYPVERDTADIKSIKTTIQLLRDGEIAGIYPQGRRSAKKHPRESFEHLKNGAAMCSERAKVGVLPVSIITKGHKAAPFKKTIVVIGKFMPYTAPELRETDSNLPALPLYRQKTRDIFSAIVENYEKYDTLNTKG